MTIANMDFAARIDRINSGKGSSKSTLYVGIDQSFEVPAHLHSKAVTTKSRKSRLDQKKVGEPVFHPLTMLWAFVLGALASGLGLYLQFRLNMTPPAEADPNVSLAINGVIGLMIAFPLAMIFRIPFSQQLLAKTAGVLAVLCLVHNLVHLSPATFDRVFSPEWTAQTLSMTEPHSAVIGARTITF